MSESTWHKTLKKDANGFLALMGDVFIKNEIRINRWGNLCVDGQFVFVIIDCVAFRNENIVAGVECGSVRDIFRYKLLPFPVYHLVSLSTIPHLIGECSFCLTKQELYGNWLKNAPKLF